MEAALRARLQHLGWSSNRSFEDNLDLSNIEAVFTTFEMGRTIRKLPVVEDDGFEAAVNSLKLLILQTIEHSMIFPLTDDGFVRAPKDYEIFTSFLKDFKG